MSSPRPASAEPGAPPNRAPESERDEWFDLFFDLVFAVAIVIWAERLAEDPTARAWAWGVAKLVPIWMLWLGQTVFAARFPFDGPRDRLLALAVVVAVGIMSTELVADAPPSWRFPLGFVAARAALLVLYASVRCLSTDARRIADAYLIGFGAGAAIWALSVLLPASHRPAVWALAIAVDFAVPWLAWRRLQRMPLDHRYVPARVGTFTSLLLYVSIESLVRLQESRLLREQRRVARELDERVARRTEELAAANEDLRREIGERRRIEEQLRREERELRRITDVIPQAVIVLAPDGSTLHANAFVLEYTGSRLEDIKAAGARGSVFHPDDLEKFADERERALSRGDPFELELRARRKDGKYRWFLVRYVPFRDEHGVITRWYATGTDIEDRKRAEERMRNENLALREEIDRSSMFEEIVGSSEGIRRVLAQVAKVARTDSTVLILGETGTGKELIARAIHRQSSRATQAFIRVNCAAIPPSLITSELFGHSAELRAAFSSLRQRLH